MRFAQLSIICLLTACGLFRSSSVDGVALATVTLPTEPCQERSWELCLARKGFTSNETSCIAQVRSTGTGCQVACNVTRLNGLMQCLRYSAGCVAFPTGAAGIVCSDFLDRIGGGCAYNHEPLCAVRPVVHSVLIVSRSPEAIIDQIELPDGTTASVSDAPIGSSAYIADNRAALEGFNFSMAVFHDASYELLADVAPTTPRFVAYPGMALLPNSRVISVDSSQLGYLAGVAVALHTESRHVAFSCVGLETQRHIAVAGFVEGVKATCPTCLISLYMDPERWRWNASIDAAVFLDTAVAASAKFALSLTLAGAPSSSLSPRTNMSLSASVDRAFIGALERQLEQFTPGLRLIDWAIPGMSQMVIGSGSPHRQRLEQQYELMTSGASFESGVVNGIARRRYLGGANAVWSTNKSSLMHSPTIDPRAVWINVAPFDYVAVDVASPDAGAKLRYYSGRSLIDVNATLVTDGDDVTTLPRLHAAITPCAAQSRDLYVVFGRNRTTQERLGDIWRLRSYVGDFSRWEASRVYRIQDAILDDPTLVVPTERYAHSATVVGSEMYVFGGVTRSVSGQATSELPDRELFVLDLSTMLWREIAVPDVAGRAYHIALGFAPDGDGGPVGLATSARVWDSRLLFVGFGQAWTATSPLLEVIGLSTGASAAVPLPTRADGTAYITGAARDNVCMTATDDLVIVAEFAVGASGGALDATVCFYMVRLGEWDSCRVVPNATLDNGALPSKCGALLDPLTETRRAVVFFSPTDSPAVFTDENVVCDEAAGFVTSIGGGTCKACPKEAYALDGVCVACADRDPNHPRTRVDAACPKEEFQELPVVIGGTTGFALVVCLIVAAIVYLQSQRQVENAMSADDLAEEVARAVATGYLVPVLYLFELKRPNRMQRSVVNILKVFELYAQFIPGWVFRADRSENDFDDSNTTRGRSQSMSLSGVEEPPYSRKSLLVRHQQQQQQLHHQSSGASQGESGNTTGPSIKSPPETSVNHGDSSLRRRIRGPDEGAVVAVDDGASGMQYKQRMASNILYTADLTVVCIRIDVPMTADVVQRLDKILSAVANVVDDGMGLVHSLWGDQVIATFNGSLTNPHHIRDAATAVCILAETLDTYACNAHFGLARGIARVGVVSGMYGQRLSVIGDVMARAQEMVVANRVLNTKLLCDWAAGNYLGASFALRIIGNWVRSPAHKYIVAEMLGMAQNDDAAVRVQEAFEEEGSRMKVRVCHRDFTAHNNLMMAIDRGDDRHRDLLIQQCRMTQAVPERVIRQLIEHGLPQYTQESGVDVGTRPTG